VIGILVAFLPAAVIGALAHDFIKTILFESPRLICIMLIIGGVVLLAVDRINFKPVHHNVERFPLSVYLKIGLFQCLSLIPGTSRSGSTIVGALLMAVDKRAAAEFSFFLAMPTMVGAFAFDLFKNRNVLTSADLPIISVGFIAAFVAALIVVRFLLDYVSRRGYALFGWWRLLVGIAGLAALTVWG
ncbi:undecaprenyl-diphosphate phosphatase, partial [Mesorhizobium sp.]